MVFPPHLTTPCKPQPTAGAPFPSQGTAVSERQWAHRRGYMGLYFWAGVSGCSLHRVMREMARACYRLGYDAMVSLGDKANPQVWGSTSISHLPGEPRPPYVNVMYGTGQGDSGMPLVNFGVADDWRWSKPGDVANINAWTDCFCVPASSNAPEYEAAGVTVPIEVVPYGVDAGVFRPWGRDEALIARCDWAGNPPTPGARLFLVAGYLQGRKNVDGILAAFNAAFTPDDNVAIIVKTVAHPSGTNQRWGFAQREEVKAQRRGLPIGYMEDDLDDWTMARLLSSATLVSAPFREGFGLMPLEAMACGQPPIVLNHDGPASYATADNCILVEPAGAGHPGVPFKDVPEAAGPGCAVVSQASLVVAFRRVAEGEAEGLREGALATAAAWTWERAARGLVAAVERHIGPVRRRWTPMDRKEGAPESGLKRGVRAILSSGALAILIPARNPGSILAAEVKDLLKTKWEAGLAPIIFDDASNEPVRTDGVRVIRSEAHVGEGAARAFLLDSTDAEWICMTDADVRFPDPEWARKLAAFCGDRRIVACPLLIEPAGKVWSAGGMYRDYGVQGWLPAWHRHAGEEPGNWPEQEVPYAPTACWFARRETLADLNWTGGYFPTVFADVEMAFQIRAQGVEFWYAPVTHAVHHHGSFTEASSAGEQAERFTAHARTFVSRWSDRIAHDLAVEKLKGGSEGAEQSDHGGSAEEG